MTTAASSPFRTESEYSEFLSLLLIPYFILCQPIDAIAAVMDGGLLGASEMNWVAQSSLVISLVVILGLLLSKRLFPTSLLALWAAMKVTHLKAPVCHPKKYRCQSPSSSILRCQEVLTRGDESDMGGPKTASFQS